METLKRYKYHILALVFLLSLLVVGTKTKQAHVSQSADELPTVGHLQFNHALELFPSEKSSLAMLAAGNTDMREFILNLVKKSLPQEQQAMAFAVAHAVISEANHNRLDPLFLLAVISTESHFNNNARGSHGELGLMQVLPSTANWLSAQAGIPANSDLHDPAINIRLGATYFAFLRHSFKHKSKHYLAAYNMGALNVRRLLAEDTEPAVYPARVMDNYEQIYLTLRDSGEAPVVIHRTMASVQ